MSKEKNGFQGWQYFGAPSVEEYCDNKEGKHDESVLPIGKRVLEVVDLDHGLDLSSHHEDTTRCTGKPAER